MENHYGPHWTPRPSFAADVERFTAGPSWVIEWQYAEVRARLLGRADILIWLDHSRWTVTQRVVCRTVRRRVRRIELWNGNYEALLRTFFTDPEHIIRWSWGAHGTRRREALNVAHGADSPLVVRLHGQHDVDIWVRGPLRQLANR